MVAGFLFDQDAKNDKVHPLPATTRCTLCGEIIVTRNMIQVGTSNGYIAGPETFPGPPNCSDKRAKDGRHSTIVA